MKTGDKVRIVSDDRFNGALGTVIQEIVDTRIPVRYGPMYLVQVERCGQGENFSFQESELVPLTGQQQELFT